jgi:hypothetical protein
MTGSVPALGMIGAVPSPSAEGRSARLELLATLLLAFATVATAWSAYQSRLWTGEQAKATSQATASRIAVNRDAAVANRQVQIDVATFIQWVDARLAHRTADAAFFRTRFREEFQPAFDAWLAAKPFTNRSAPLTPFAMPEYRLAASAQADRRDAAASALSVKASEANSRAGDYMLAVVLFASALFFAGTATRLQSPGVRIALLGCGCVLLVGTLAWVVTLPAELTA